MPAVVPAIGLGISAYSAWKNGKAASAALRSQNQMIGQGSAALSGAANTGGALNASSLPAFQQSVDYNSKLLGGNRAMMNQAVAAPAAQITSIYRGAQRGLERSGVRGGERDMAMADLNRERASKLAGLTTGVQGEAANNLGQLSTRGLAIGLNAQTEAANGFGNLAGQQGQNYRFAAGQQAEDMQGVGRGIGELFKVWSNRRHGGVNAPSPIGQNIPVSQV